MIASRWAKALRDCVGMWPICVFFHFSLGGLPAGAALNELWTVVFPEVHAGLWAGRRERLRRGEESEEWFRTVYSREH